ncbi:MAG TPA: hypothetical protein PLY45_03545, partial [bacterium]|nr:hypothetical protein [bacterium]
QGVEGEFEKLMSSELSEIDVQTLLEGRRIRLKKGRRARGVAKRMTKRKKGVRRKAQGRA